MSRESQISLKVGIAEATECLYFACLLLSLVKFYQPTQNVVSRKLFWTERTKFARIVIKQLRVILLFVVILL